MLNHAFRLVMNGAELIALAAARSQALLSDRVDAPATIAEPDGRW